MTDDQGRYEPDPEFLAEIELLTDVVIAATQHHGFLPQGRLDAVLGLAEDPDAHARGPRGGIPGQQRRSALAPSNDSLADSSVN